MGRKKVDHTTYTIKITGEHIKLIRSLMLHADMLFDSAKCEEYLNDHGGIEYRSVYSCRFCQKGSYESKQAIPHTSTCIVIQAQQTYGSLNAQFMAAEQALEAK